MKFYFYTNKNIMFDFLGRNIIAPDTVVRDIKQYRTIATASDYFLFVTHMRLDRRSREQGIGETDFVYPVALELSDLQADDGQAVLVSKTKSGIEYTLKKLSEYDPKTCIGAYLIGEIPLSRIEKIYFDTQDDQDMFSRPSPDYWYPTNKYGLLPEDFSEKLTLKLDEERILEASGLSVDDMIKCFREREKHRAAILNLINGTKKWQHDQYLFNIDDRMQKLLGLKDKDISTALPHYVKVKDKGIVEYLCLAGETQEHSQEFNQKIYNHIWTTLVLQAYNNQKQPELIVEILHSLRNKIVAECKSKKEATIIQQLIGEIEKLISDSTNKSPEEIMASIPEPIDVLKALMFVVKNPNRYDLFLEALDAYHADQLTKRRAAILWGALNGLYGMPGENHNKDNQQLWQFIEAFVLEKASRMQPSLSVKMPNVRLEKKTVLGITLEEERIITAEEIRRTILDIPKEKIPNIVYSKLLEAAEIDAGSKKKAENRGYTHIVASIDLPQIKKGDILNASKKKILEQLIKDCKNPVPNREKLFVDYVEDQGKFVSVFDRDPDFWKKMIKTAPEKKNA